MNPISRIVFSSKRSRSFSSGVTVLVALLQALLAELDEVVERVAAVGHRELRQEDLAELDLDVAALGDLERAAQRVVVAGEVAGHLLGRLEEEVVGLELPVVRVLERVARLDAEQRLVGARVLVRGGSGRRRSRRSAGPVVAASSASCGRIRACTSRCAFWSST